ncbi:MAG: hypothetical protein ACQEP7_04620 [bacterium]
MVSSDVKGIQKRTRKLEPGMILCKPVHSRDGSRLFPEGKQLNQKDITKLENWNIRFVYVEPADDKPEKARKAS